jgi:phage FluMu gp28-like protein
MLTPLSDTQRIVEWDELPDSVREIPDNFNPLDEGVFMKHQVEWIQLIHEVDLGAAEKCRRSGITLATAFDDTITAASRKSAGGSNIFYIGDTREKGLEFIGYVAKFAKVIVAAQGEGVSQIEQFIFEDQSKRGEATQQITAFRVRFASGYRVVALSSRPENIHGLQGIVDIDEAALHKDVRKVIESATALLIWGGKMRIISTHRGVKNPFNDLIRDIKNGLYGKSAAVFRITFDECVANGLYERVCFMQGIKPTPEGKKDWYERIRKAYGPRKSAMREELDVIPRDGDGSAIAGLWIERAMKEDRPVLRLSLSDDFKHWAVETRTKEIEAWIKRELEPCLKLLDPTRPHFFGMDFARKKNLSVITPLAKQQNLTRKVPFVIELFNCPILQQQQILWYLISKLPRFSGGAMDASGSGQNIAELTWEKFPQVEQITLSNAWYRDNMGAFVQAFEDDMFDIPRDSDHEDDLRDLERIDGIVKLPKGSSEEDETGMARHGDYAISLALADYAARHCKTAPIEFASTGVHRDGLRAYGQTGKQFGSFGADESDYKVGFNDFNGFI